MKLKLIGPCAVLALCACDRGGSAAPDGTANQSASAEGKAEDGRVTVKTPGVDISIRIPEAARNRMASGENNAMLPPDVRIGGVHVQGDGSEGGSGDSGAVELTFSSDQGPEALAAWYRDPARAQHFSVASDSREGTALVLRGPTRGEGPRNGGRFSVRLSPRQGGGTGGRLTLSDRP